MKEYKIIFAVCLCFLVSGCAKKGSWERLMTMKAIAKEQKDNNRYLEELDEKFDHLLSEVKAGKMDTYESQEDILEELVGSIQDEHD